jgi:hypothetical protein
VGSNKIELVALKLFLPQYGWGVGGILYKGIDISSHF